MSDWLWVIPGSPLLGALFTVAVGSLVRPGVVAWVATAAVAVSAIMVAALWAQGGGSATFEQTLYVWMSVGEWQPRVGLTVDRITMVTLSVCTGVGFLIHLFSVRHMEGDYGERRYFFFLNLFVAGFLILVMADNLLLLYLGWETVGLCSYALVAHWYREQHNAWAGRKCFVVTRIGDVALALAIFVVFAHYGALGFDQLFEAAGAAPVDSGVLTLVLALFLVGAVTKSAQLPLHVWLPDAMTGPATVSALIHAATMVTAGVYLIARTHPLFELAPDMQWVVALVGGLTLVYSASAGLAQWDIKRVLAFSTISQIGYMFLGLGIGAYSLALLHLVVHGCFKSLLFMSAGVVIHVYDDDHDIRNMGGLARSQPWLRWCFLAGAMSLAAVPLISASFYSKDAIIAAAWAAPYTPVLLWSLGLGGAILTGTYTFRLYLMVFHGTGRKEPTEYTMPFTMKIPLAILAVLSLTIGFLQFPPDWPGPHVWVPWLAPETGLPPTPSAQALPWLEIAGALASLIGIAIAVPIVRREREGRGLSNVGFLLNSWYFDAFYDHIIVRPYYAISGFLRTVFENGVLNGALLGSVVGALRFGNLALRVSENGSMARYAGVMVLGSVVVLGYLLLSS
jgi:NADH-quinone oxidoreductase subunit L